MAESKSRRGRKPRLSPDAIVSAALELLEQRGLPDLSMRRIGQALDAQPSALYWHFPDKQTLLAEVSKRILGDEPTSDPSQTWELTMRTAAAGLREHLLAHRDGAELVSSSYALGLVTLPLATELTEPLHRAGATDQAITDITDTLGHFILGHTFHQQQREAATGTSDEDASFTAGVELILGGTAVRLSMDLATR